MRIRVLALLAFAVPMSATAAPFDFSKTQYIYAVTADEAIAYAKFPMFLQFRDMLTNSMTKEDRAEVSSPALFQLRVIGVGELTEVHVGRDWIRDGQRIVRLEEDEFQWIKEAIEGRRGTGIELDRLDSSIQWDLAEQDDPAWRPDVW